VALQFRLHARRRRPFVHVVTFFRSAQYYPFLGIISCRDSCIAADLQPSRRQLRRPKESGPRLGVGGRPGAALEAVTALDGAPRRWKITTHPGRASVRLATHRGATPA